VVAIAALTAGVIVLTRRRVGTKPRKKRFETEQVMVKMPKPEAVPEAAKIRPTVLTKLEDPRSCVREVYWEMRRSLVEALHEGGRPSETHREFEAKISSRLSDGAAAFHELTMLFEFAEYSEHRISHDDAEKAINNAILVAEALNLEVNIHEM
jgi:hypothetical protein